MKKFILLAFLLISTGIALKASSGQLQSNFVQNYGSYCRMEYGAEPREFFARSFMYPKPLWLNITTQQAMWYDMIYDNNNDIGLKAQITGAYLHSRPDCTVDQYFMLPCKNVLLVAGDETSEKPCRDIRAEWINLPSDFVGKFSLFAEQSQFMINLELNHNIGEMFDIWLFKGYWASIELPVVSMTNNLKLCENVIQSGTPKPYQPTNIAQAFNQPTWDFGKICGPRNKLELAALKLRMGKAWMNTNHHQLAYYTGIILPTSSKQNPEYLFDPVTGLCGHVGLNAGVNVNVLLNRDIERFTFCFFANLDDTFLVRNDQCRTFGLLDVPLVNPKYLSRFIGFNKANCPAEFNVPGVNVLTQEVRVKPYNLVDFSTGFRITVREWFESEFAFGIWGHTQEELQLLYPQYFNLGLYGVAGSDAQHTASRSTIAQQAEDDLFFTPLQISDLDFSSAASASALVYKAQGSFGIKHAGKIDTFVVAGFSLDFPQKNSALKTWSVWAKMGSSF